MHHLIFDTETTNLIHNSLQPINKQPRVIEFFGLLLKESKDQQFEEVATLHTFINPEMAIPEKVTKITGITNDVVAGAQKFAEFAPHLLQLISRANIVAAHNLSYDKAVIDFELKRISKPCLWPVGICTVEATEHLCGYRLSLTALHTELFGQAFEHAHSAEHDVRALARCYIELVRRGVL